MKFERKRNNGLLFVEEIDSKGRIILMKEVKEDDDYLVWETKFEYDNNGNLTHYYHLSETDEFVEFWQSFDEENRIKERWCNDYNVQFKYVGTTVYANYDWNQPENRNEKWIFYYKNENGKLKLKKAESSTGYVEEF